MSSRAAAENDTGGSAVSPQSGPEPFSTDYDAAPAYWQIGILWNVLISGEQTFGQFTLMDQTMPQDSGPPAHMHERMSEGFYILDGEIEYLVGDEKRRITGRAGTTVWIPPGTPHSFKVTSPHARALNFYTPGGFDDRFKYLAKPAAERTLPPPDLNEEVDEGTQKAFLSRLRDLHQETWVDPESKSW